MVKQKRTRVEREDLQEPLLVTVVPIGHVHGNQECRGGHKDQLEAPEADVGDGKELVVADILTARLEMTQRHTECGLSLNKTLRS